MSHPTDRAPLYIHLPLCRHLCPFCDLPKALFRESLVPRLLRALGREIETSLPSHGWQPRAVFIGGGTPTALPPGAFREVLARVSNRVDLSGASEISLEVEPGTLTDAHLGAFLAFGGNRISLGAQSFDPDVLKTLGRHHDPTEIGRDAARARTAGIHNINLDVLFAVPGADLRSFENDLHEALAIEPNHLSLYNLTFERRTLFHRWKQMGRLLPASEKEEIVLYRRAMAILRAHGWRHYEVSNFCRPGFACRYNRHVWSAGDYRGIGPSAASHHNGRRHRNLVSTLRYVLASERDESLVEERETLDPETRIRESLFLALRQPRGLRLDLIRHRTGMDPLAAEAWPVVERLARQGWIVLDASRVRPSSRGLLRADSLAAAVLQAPRRVAGRSPPS